MLRKILVCLDGSAFAERVLPAVREEASRVESSVTLFHILTVDIPLYVPPSSEPACVPFGLVARAIDAHEATMRSYLSETANALRARGLVADSAMVRGRTADLGEDIAAWATDHGYSLIAMAAHGRTGFRRFLWGSVTESVMRRSSVALLVVRPGAPSRVGDAAAGVLPDFTLSSDGT